MELRSPPFGRILYGRGRIARQLIGEFSVQCPVARVQNSAQAPRHYAEGGVVAELEDLLPEVEVVLPAG